MKATINTVFWKRTFRFTYPLWLRFNRVTSQPICGSFLSLILQNQSYSPTSPLEKPQIDHSVFWKPAPPYTLSVGKDFEAKCPHSL